MSEEAELPSPAATIVSRRASRSAMPERLKVAARRQLRRRMGSRRGCGRFRRGGQRCGGQWCRWRREAWSRDGALHRVTLLRPGGARRPAQEPGREDLGEAVSGSTQRVCLWRGELRSGAWARARGRVGEEHARVRRGQLQRRWHRGTKDVLLSDSARGGMTRRYGSATGYAGGLGSRPSGQHSA